MTFMFLLLPGRITDAGGWVLIVLMSLFAYNFPPNYGPTYMYLLSRTMSSLVGQPLLLKEREEGLACETRPYRRRKTPETLMKVALSKFSKEELFFSGLV